MAEALPVPSPLLRAVQRWACDLGVAGSVACMAWQAGWDGEGAVSGFVAIALWVAAPFVALRLLGRWMRRCFPLLAGVSVVAALLIPATYGWSFAPKHLTSTAGLVFISLPVVQWVMQGGVLGVGCAVCRLASWR